MIAERTLLTVGMDMEFFSIIKYLSSLFGLYQKMERIGKPDKEVLNEIITNEYSETQLKHTANRLLQKEYFYQISGLYLEDSKKRNLIMRLNRESEGKLPLFYFKRAYRFLEFEENNVAVVISKKDERADKIQKISSMLLLSLAMLFMVIWVITKQIGSNMPYQLSIFFGLMFLAIVVYVDTFKLWSAKEIEKYLQDEVKNE